VTFVCLFDPPNVLDASVTPIPAAGSPTLTIIADTGPLAAVGIQAKDSTGGMIGVYIGAVGKEVLLCVVGNGTDSTTNLPDGIPKHSRISLRSMSGVAINAGLLFGGLFA
jgi:hypothetical protein